jgi:DNA processing protein
VIEAIGTGLPHLRNSPVSPDPVVNSALLPGPAPERRPLADITQLHSQILARLGPSPLAEDQLIRDLAMPPSRITPELLTLELEGKVLRQAGGLLSRVG